MGSNTKCRAVVNSQEQIVGVVLELYIPDVVDIIDFVAEHCAIGN